MTHGYEICHNKITPFMRQRFLYLFDEKIIVNKFIKIRRYIRV